MHRKHGAVLLALCLISAWTLAGCSTQDGSKSQSASPSSIVSQSPSNADLSVTLPSVLLEGANLEQTKKNAYSNGVAEIIETDDGSLTYRMTQTVYDRMAQSTEEDMESLLASFQTGSDFPTIQQAQADEGYRSIVLLADQQAYQDSHDSSAPASVGIPAVLYQLFHGVDANEVSVTVSLQDTVSGETFSTFTFPMDA